MTEHKDTHARTHARTQKCTHAHTHAHTHTHTQTQTHSCTWQCCVEKVLITVCLDKPLVVHISQSSKCLSRTSPVHRPPTYLFLPHPSFSMAAIVTMETEKGLEGCCHADASVRAGGILGLPGPLPSLSREEISVNDIQEGDAWQPDSFLAKGGREECVNISS